MSQSQEVPAHAFQVDKALEHARRVTFRFEGGKCQMTELTPAYQQLVERCLDKVHEQLVKKPSIDKVLPQMRSLVRKECAGHLDEAPGDIMEIIKQMLTNGEVRKKVDIAAQMLRTPEHPAGRGRPGVGRLKLAVR